MYKSVKEKTVPPAIAALFTAVIVVLSQTAIPLPNMPVTLQTFAVALCAYSLGVKWSLASVGTYVLLGAVGIPVFTGFKGGIQCLFGVTGGFIYGFLFFAAVTGASLKLKAPPLKLLLGIAGLVICHLFGVLQFALVYQTSVRSAFLIASFPFLIKDVISVAAAYTLSLAVHRILKRRFADVTAGS